MGLENDDPETIETSTINSRYLAIIKEKRLTLGGTRNIHYDMDKDMVSSTLSVSECEARRGEFADPVWFSTRLMNEQLWKMEALPTHPNGMRFAVFDENGE